MLPSVALPGRLLQRCRCCYPLAPQTFFNASDVPALTTFSCAWFGNHVSTRVFLYQVGVGIVDEGRVGSCVASVRRQVDNATLTQFDRLQPIQGKQAGVACMHTGQNPEPGRFRAASTPQFPGTPGKVWSTGARCRCRTERLGLLHGEYIKDITVFETRSSDLSRLSVGSNYRECGIYHR